MLRSSGTLAWTPGEVCPCRGQKSDGLALNVHVKTTAVDHRAAAAPALVWESFSAGCLPQIGNPGILTACCSGITCHVRPVSEARLV